MSSQVDEGLVAVRERRCDEMTETAKGRGGGGEHTSDSSSLHPVTFFTGYLPFPFTRSFGPPEDSKCISEGASLFSDSTFSENIRKHFLCLGNMTSKVIKNI